MSKKKELIKEPKKARKYSVKELRERKNFMIKVTLSTLGIFSVLASIIIPVSLLIG